MPTIPKMKDNPNVTIHNEQQDEEINCEVEIAGNSNVKKLIYHYNNMNNTGGHYPQTTIQQQQELSNASSFIMNQRMPQPSFPSIQQNPFMINQQSVQQQRDLFNLKILV